jgi:hypothetical protein
MSKDTYSSILLEVSNIRLRSDTKVEVQLRSERDPPSPRWWLIGANPPEFKVLAEALEKKRPVLAQLAATAGPKLEITGIIIQYAETIR